MLKKLDSIKAFLFEVSASHVAIPGLRKLLTYLRLNTEFLNLFCLTLSFKRYSTLRKLKQVILVK